MPNALVLLGHADPGSFNHRLAAAYADGFAAGGAVERLDLTALRFDPVLRHGYRTDQPLEPDLLAARAAIERADHLIWVFPTYWAAPPAVVRGFVDRVFLPGWAFRFEGHALPTGLLAGRASRVVTTMDSPGWWYRLALRRTLHASFGRGTLAFCGLAPVAFTTIHRTRALDAAARDRWLAQVGALAARDARRGPRRARIAARAAA
ncbi:MAG: NAD(P)H-dependent oxidoreductase [Myxococcales bacterium]|nr:NAD(P)H-dependent oxidoreductase [Myxococcales bacterium]MBK7198293.1 NAD(P)H-dependent oxidoreductase [Myxococcales bacterium]MBP6843714.1 NAD(P)H-dependent oxidoreductase [Kofleriaceae bacterium]